MREHKKVYGDKVVHQKGIVHKAIFGIGKNRLKGGLGDKLTEKDVDPVQFEKGLKVEMEHTGDANIAREIVLDHLAEYPDYYDRLEKIETTISPKKLRDEDTLWDTPIEMLLPSMKGYTLDRSTHLKDIYEDEEDRDNDYAKEIKKYMSEHKGSEKWDAVWVTQQSNRAALFGLSAKYWGDFETSDVDYVSDEIQEHEEYQKPTMVTIDTQYDVVVYDGDGRYLIVERETE